MISRNTIISLIFFLPFFAQAGSLLHDQIKAHFPEVTDKQFYRLGKPLIDELAVGNIPELIVLIESDATNEPLPAHNSSESRKRLIQQQIHHRGLAIEKSLLDFDSWLTTKQHKVKIQRTYSQIPLVAVSVQKWQDIALLLRHPRVIAVTSDEPMKRLMSHSLPLINQHIAITNGIDGSGTTVAIFDSGVDYTHSKFGSCTSPGVPASCRVLYTDDYAPDDGVLDDDGHGTFVSAIVAGVAAATNLVVFDVFDGASAYSSDVIDAINWVIANAATYNIVAGNFSLGNGQEYSGDCDSFFPPPSSNPYKSAFDAMRSVGILPVVASGNEAHTNGISSPACVSSGFSVGATYNTTWPNLSWGTTPPCTDTGITADDIACFSNSGPNLDMLAPGSIISTVGTTSSGTSMAAPMVAGAAAVIHQQFPLEGLTELEARLKTSATSILDNRNGLSFPRLDLQSALELTDSDNDGVPNLFDPDNQDPCIPSQFASPCTIDTDGDGKTDTSEGEFTDTDNDGLPDYLESSILDPDGDGLSDELDPANVDPCAPSQFASPCTLDSDGDGKTDASEGEITDSDGDGSPDYLESASSDEDSDGTFDELDPANADPCVPSQFASTCTLDSDGDGKTDAEEGETTDTDTDGHPDYLESAIMDADNDGEPDELDQNDADPCIPSVSAETCDIQFENVPLPFWFTLGLFFMITVATRTSALR